MIRQISIALILILTGCHQSGLDKREKIEKFIWIRHNANWIRDTSDLKARVLIVFNDSSERINVAEQFISKNESEFLTSQSVDTLRNMIYKSLYGKLYSTNYLHRIDKIPEYIWDGDIYLLIYKFSNQSEKFINYIPPELPDSLLSMTDYLDKFSSRHGSSPGVPFDINAFFNKYKNLFLDYLILPPQEISSDSVKYK
jgi:hypothetical protein